MLFDVLLKITYKNIFLTILVTIVFSMWLNNFQELSSKSLIIQNISALSHVKINLENENLSSNHLNIYTNFYKI